jgi:hypothetical protein
MKDMLAHLDMLRSQIAECERLQGAFALLAAHYTGLARELEAAIVAASQPIPHAFLGRNDLPLKKWTGLSCF